MRTAAAIAAIASGLGLLSGLKTWYLSAVLGIPRDPGWLPLGLAAWYLVAVPYPIFAAAADRVRPDRLGWTPALTTHAAIWLAFWVVFTTSFAAFRVAIAQHEMALATTWMRDAFWALNWTLFIYSAIVGVLWSVGYRHQAREARLRAERTRKDLAEQQIRALRAQIEPHFLFNALHGVLGLIADRPPAAKQMLLSLAELLRTSLRRDRTERSTLGDELRLAGHYLSLQEVRFRDRFVVTRCIEQGLEDIAVPRLLLVTLLENAMTHAVAPSQRRIRIEIGARREVDRVVVEVGDDGPGLRQSPGGGSGIGLDNTRKRLHAMYGDAAAVELVPRRPGLLVRITLPAAAREPQ